MDRLLPPASGGKNGETFIFTKVFVFKVRYHYKGGAAALLSEKYVGS